MANEYLKRTPTSTGNRKVYTWSGWVKRNRSTGSVHNLFSAGSDQIAFRLNGAILEFRNFNGGSTIEHYAGGSNHNDFGSWMHFMLVQDNTIVLPSQDRVKLFVNGKQVDEFSTLLTPNDNQENEVNQSGQTQYIGARDQGSGIIGQYMFGQMSDIFLVDGQALTPDVFGYHKDGAGYISVGSAQATSFKRGQWVPKKPSSIKAAINAEGGFGVNGFYLPINDGSNMGADFHCEPNSIITLKGENNPQPRNGAPTTSNAYVSQLRTDPYAANLVLAVPGISTSTSATILSNGHFDTDTTNWTLGTATGTLVAANGELEIQRVSTNGTYCYQAITTEAGKRYTVSFETRTTDAAQPAKFQVGTTINGQELLSRIDTYSTTMTHHTASFTATGTTTYVTLGSNYTANSFWNNIVVKQEDAPRDYSADIRGSGTNKTLTPNSAAGVGYEIPSYYGSALSFDGTNDYFTTPNSSDFYFNGDFTVECWLYRNVTNTSESIVGVFENSVARRSWIIETRSNSAIRFQWWSDGSSSSDITSANNSVPGGQWHHIAMVKNNDTITGYVNGVAVGIDKTAGSIYENTDDPLRIGILNAAEDQDFNGYIQDLRVYKGVAKYKGGFDVPKPYTPVGMSTWRAVPDTTANNFATLNPLQSVDNPNYASDNTTTLSNGNLTATKTSASSNEPIPGTIAFPVNGRFDYEMYLEAVTSTGPKIGVCLTNAIVPSSFGYSIVAGGIYITTYSTTITVGADTNTNGSGSATELSSTQVSAGDVVSMAVDLTSTRRITFYINGTEVGYAENFDETEFVSVIQSEGGNNTYTAHWNFGQNPTFSGTVTAGTYTDSNGKGLFKYQPPTGFLALCEDNLPTPAIANPGEHFKTVLYTGDASNGRSITGVGFKPDLIWFKGRNAAVSHVINDTVRGVTEHLNSNNTSAASIPGFPYLNSVDNDGFSLLGGTSSGGNISGRNYVAWCWKAGAGTTSTNTDGAVNSVVSVNQTAGFSIIKVDGLPASTTSTFGHGLNKKPDFIIFKSRNNATNWEVYHSSLTPDGERKLYLNGTNAEIDSGFMGDTPPTSSVISFNPGSSNSNHIVYCWTEIEGFSKFGNYVGNGSADGTFVYCGFKPAFVMIKRTDTTGEWWMYDNARGSTNPIPRMLLANSSGVENEDSASYLLDFLSNGFKWRSGLSASNGNGGTYIFAAFAESPFQTANAK